MTLAAHQVRESDAVKCVSAFAICKDLRGADAHAWLAIVKPVVDTPEQASADAAYEALCSEFADVFEEPGTPPKRQLEHAIDLIDESLPPPKHRQYRLSPSKQAEVQQQVE